MHEVALLKDLVIVLGAAVIVVAVLRHVGIPSVAGFILTGVLAGPTAGWSVIVLGGGLQVVVTIACAAAAATWFGMSSGAARFLGCVVAVSSTAIVLKGLSRRGEIDAPHRRLAVGILVFQDLCVVPMILAVPFLAGQGGSTEEVLYTATSAPSPAEPAASATAYSVR